MQVQKTGNYSQSFGKNQIVIDSEIKDLFPKVHKRLERLAETLRLGYAGNSNSVIGFGLVHHAESSTGASRLAVDTFGANLVSRVPSVPTKGIAVSVTPKPRNLKGTLMSIMGFAPSVTVKAENSASGNIVKAVEQAFSELV